MCKHNCFCCSLVGPTGPQGENWGILNFANFYALMPPDNSAIIAPLTGGTQAVSVHLVITRLQ